MVNDPPIISKIKPFMNQYNCGETNFPAEPKDWKMFELNNKANSLNNRSGFTKR